MTPHVLGGNVYLWSRAAQDRFLVDCLEPTIRELREKGQAGGFWFDRFDARGPHIFFLLRPAEDPDPVRDLLTRRLEDFQATAQSLDETSPADIEERHRQVLGTTLCSADELPGLADNNSFALFDHDPEGYPFRIAAPLDDPPGFLHLWEDLSLWSLRQLQGDPDAARATGIRWAAALDRSLRKAGLAKAFWRHHAETLFPGLIAGQPEPEAQRILAYLAKAVGARNRETFARQWKNAETIAPPWPKLPALVKTALAAKQPEARLAALRETMHCVWKQLGIPVHQEIPVVLFGWGRG